MHAEQAVPALFVPNVIGTILNKVNLFVALECLAQLHGTGMAYALSHANSSQEKTLHSLTGNNRLNCYIQM
jgi:hypothetical protein